MLNILLERISKIAMENLNSATGISVNVDLWEYLLVVHPTEEVRIKVLNEKRIFESKYEQESDTEFHPQISIANFWAKEVMEETFIRWIQNICNLQRNFTVTLNNYSAFPSSGLYLRIQNEEPFKRLANALKILDGFMQTNDCPPLKLVSRPHMTMVSGLARCTFENVVRDYARKTFHESFKVEKLILLKRDTDMKCYLINTFILPSPSTVFD